MKTALFLIAIVILFLLVSGISIKLNPFKVTLHDWKLGVGWLLVVIGLTMVTAYHTEKAEINGYKQAIKDIYELEGKSQNM